MLQTRNCVDHFEKFQEKANLNWSITVFHTWNMLKIRIVLKLGLFHHLENFQEACKSQLVKLETRNPVKVKVTFIIVKSFRKQGSSNWSRILILARNMLFQSFEKFQEAGKSQKATICLERFSCCKQEIMIHSFGQQHVHFWSVWEVSRS